MNDNGPDYGDNPGSEQRQARLKLAFYFGVFALALAYTIFVVVPRGFKQVDLSKVANAIATVQAPKTALHQIGSLPADICVINGVPQVLNANYEPALSGGPTLTYLRENGDLVVLKYSNTDYSRLVDTFVWSGGHCGAKASQ